MEWHVKACNGEARQAMAYHVERRRFPEIGREPSSLTLIL